MIKKLVEEELFRNADGLYCVSKVCGVATSVGSLKGNLLLEGKITELTQSFFNQWQLTIEAYEKLNGLFEQLNECSIETTAENPISQYDLFAMNNESEFRYHTYVFIISLKTYLDLLTSVVDISVGQKDNGNYYPDLVKVGRSIGSISDLKKVFDDLSKPDVYPWIDIVRNARNNIVHRGYNLKLKAGNSPSKELVIQMYKGTDLYTNQEYLYIDQLMNDFLIDFPKIEEKIVDVLVVHVPILNNRISHESTFSFHDSISIYGYNEI